MLRKYFASLVLVSISSIPVQAADADTLWPPETTLTRAGATQHLFLGATTGGQIVGDRTSQAQFTSSNPEVATIDAAGVITAVHDGTCTISAVRPGQKTTTHVRVQGA